MHCFALGGWNLMVIMQVLHTWVILEKNSGHKGSNWLFWLAILQTMLLRELSTSIGLHRERTTKILHVVSHGHCPVHISLFLNLIFPFTVINYKISISALLNPVCPCSKSLGLRVVLGAQFLLWCQKRDSQEWLTHWNMEALFGKKINREKYIKP